MRTVSFALATFCLAMTTPLPATAKCNDKYCEGAVERLYLDERKLHVQIAGDRKRLGCQATAGVYISTDISHAAMSDWHGMLLGAYLSNSEALVRIKTGVNPCQISYVSLTRK